MIDSVSLGEARRITLAALGFDQPRPHGRIDVRHVRRVIHRLGLIQIDYANVLIPAHYQVLFSRLGPYDRSLLDELVYRRREFTEQWAHEASIVPVEIWPLLHHRRETHRVQPPGFEVFLAKHSEYVTEVVEHVRSRGALTAGELTAPEGAPRRVYKSWFGSVPRAVLDAHFGRGVLAVTNRLPNFARAFDLAERVIPAEHHQRRMETADAQRELLRRAARAYGIASAADLADYYRMPLREARPRITELLEAGDLREVRVEGWRSPAYLDPRVRIPREIVAASLISPFDPLVWYRPRLKKLFDFDYRLEIYMPQSQRRWGYYVLPFLLGGRLVARVDLKADRERKTLLVLSALLESHAEPGEVAAPLAIELRTMASWLGLESVSVVARSRFPAVLRRNLTIAGRP